MSWLNPSRNESRRRNLIIAAMSVAATSIVVTGFLIENRWGYAKPPSLVIYIDSWKDGRTRSEAEVAQRRTLFTQREEIAAAQAKVDRHTSDRDKARLKAMAAANAAAIAALDAQAK